ncbi:MAG: hypothetical protein QXR53_04720 [Candidatus Norongarragalinales archaeon]
MPQASALAQLSVSPSGLSACSCDPIYYDVEVYSDRDDVFEMSFESEFPFSSFMQPQLPVPSGSTIKTTLVLNSACNSREGNYSFAVAARGRMGAARGEGYALIRSCRNLEVSMPPQQSVCSGGSQSVLITVKNNGLVNEKGSLAFENLPRSFYTLASDSFDLNPGKTQNFLLSIQPPSDTPPSSFSYNVRANYAVATAGVEIQACNFEGPDRVILTPSANKVELCAGSKKAFPLSIKNEGMTASFDLTSSGAPGFFAPDRISVSKGATRTVDFTINGARVQPGNKTLVLNAFGPASSDAASVDVVFKDCLSAVFGDLELCLGDSGSIPFSFKNNNPSPREYVFSSQSQIPSRVEPSSVLLSANQAITASLFVTGSALGSYNVFVYANATILKTPRVIVKSCLPEGGPLRISNKNFEGEAGIAQAFSLQFTSQLQNASITLPQKMFSVSSMRVEGDRLVFTAIPLAQGVLEVPALIVANGQLIEEKLSFSIRTASVEVREKSQSTVSSNGSVLKNELLLVVSNKGVEKVSLAPSLSVEGAVFEPSSLELNPGEEKELKVVFEAEANTSVSLELLSQEKRSYPLKTTAVQAPSSTTGFFTATRAVGLFAIIIVIALIVLAFFLKREFQSNAPEDAEGKEGKNSKK